MKKCILVPDSFKGTMSSIEICAIMRKTIQRYFPGCEIVEIPVADGGEGTVDSFLLALGGEKVDMTVSGPHFEPVPVYYGLVDHGATAVIEMAACAGLPRLQNQLDPTGTTTYGVGEMIADAANRGCERIIVGLGGSCTNDGGAGMAAALGTRFYNRKGEVYVPVGRTLCELERIEFMDQDYLLKEVELLGMCDVDNTLCGDLGAARVFGPQKGADEATILELDHNLRHMAQVVRQETGLDLLEIPGTGAAGGAGAGMLAFLGAQLRRGIEIVLDAVNFDGLVEDADCVFTGEGKIDSQSLNGKVVMGVAKHAKLFGVPVVAVVGDVGDNIHEIYHQGVSSIFSTNTVAVPYAQAKLRAKDDLAFTMDNLMRLNFIFAARE